ncbi:MAG TPA: hypothetical protein VFV93_11630, partial [Thermomicrobiales bacterium]|nr:hypothetical protein [Thermomicrobiales bacterium]
MAGLPPLVAEIESGVAIDHARLAELSDSERTAAVVALLQTPAGRRWLRLDPELDADAADRLLIDDDFRQPRRDRSLVQVVERASLPEIERHVEAIAAGPAASTLWQRLAVDHERLVALATRLVADGGAQAAEATLHLLVLDQLDPYGIGVVARQQIASSALGSSAPVVGGR